MWNFKVWMGKESLWSHLKQANAKDVASIALETGIQFLINSNIIINILTNFSIDGEWPKVRSAHAPSVIVWENLTVGPLSRCFRSFLTGLISLVIMAVSLTGIVVAKYY